MKQTGADHRAFTLIGLFAFFALLTNHHRKFPYNRQHNTRFRKCAPLQRLTSFTLLGSDWLIVAGGADNEKSWLALLNPLHQAWTLGPELTFYLLAPWLLRSGSASLFALVASFATRLTFVHTIGQSDTWTYIFLPSTFMFFMLGHFARVASTHYVQMYKPVVAYSLLGVGVVLLAFPPPAANRANRKIRVKVAVDQGQCVMGVGAGVINKGDITHKCKESGHKTGKR